MDAFFFESFACLIALISIHLSAFHADRIPHEWQRKLLSAAGGVSIAYVFIDLLPKFCSGASTVEKAFQGVVLFPYLERHVYILALLGLLFSYTMQRVSDDPRQTREKAFWTQISSYSFYNFMIGYSLANENNPDIQPIALFALAMGLHYFINDYNLRETNRELYMQGGRWIVSLCLILGWFLGFFFQIPEAALALVLSFLSGAIMMNVFRHEIPEDNPTNYSSFVWGAVAYAALLLSVG